MIGLIVAVTAVAEAYAGLSGCWSGALEYRDYQSDGMAEIPVRTCVTAAPNADHIAEAMAFTDPGFLVYSHSVLQAIDEGDSVRETFFRDGNIDVREKAVASFDETENGFTLRLVHVGLDNEAPAEIQETITVSGDDFVREKAVRPVDSHEPFAFRNRTRLSREVALH